MVLNKALLIKGLAGLSTIAATSTAIGLNWNKIFNSSNNAINNSSADQTQKSIVKEAGLTCDDESSATGSDCTIDTTKLKVDQTGTKTESFSSKTGSGKIKLYKLTSGNTDGYNQDFKLVVEDGDITLGSTKLEEFETYEIKEEDGKYYLSRKDKANKKIRELLGLPESCTLPDSTSSSSTPTCTIDSNKINDIKFDGKSSTPATPTGTSLPLTITKLESTDTDFSPYNYKFSFQPTQDVTISGTSKNITLKANTATEFKIKKSGSSLTLEEAWTLEKLLEKVGLSVCSSNSSECTIGSLNVKQGDSNKGENKTKESTSSGKIKLYTGTDAAGYEHGFKFVIEDGDITLTGGSSSGTISKLEEFETYEIKKETSENKWFFSRKKTSSESIKDSLGIPSDCNLTDDNNGCSEVTVNSSNIGQIKFDGISGNQNPSITGTAKLTVSKETTDTDFPYKFKFSFKADNSSSTTININNSKSFSLDTSKGTEFKIKKSGNTLSLEEAWTLEKLLEKVGLSGCTTSSPECNINGSLKVKQGSTEDANKTKDSSSSGKIKLYTSDAAGYEHGFKFVIEDGDIALTGGSNTISKLEQFETYEIKKETSGTDWYLTRKKEALEEKRRILGLPDEESCKLPTDSETKTCSEIDETKLKAINFDGKNSSGTPTIGDSKKVTITITKTSDSPFTDGGYKFQFTSEGEVSIPKESSGNISIKKGTNTEFKIKKAGNKLTLEKAWSVTELAKQVGLTNCASNECTIPTSDSLKLNNGSSDKVTNAKATTSDQKIKYQEDVEGHNQGFKFYVENEVTLADSKRIEKDNVSYEIKKEDNEWYLTKKSNGVSS